MTTSLHNASSFTLKTLVTLLLLIPTLNYGQTAPNLGTAATYAVFTGDGQFANAGTTTITGDIGTTTDAFSGFPPGVVMGDIHVNDAQATQAAADVAAAYQNVLDVNNFCDFTEITPIGNQVFGAGVYCIGSATVIEGDLTLDAGGNPDALFIFKIDGALSTNLTSRIILTGAASLCNVYWHVTGAASLGENSEFRGTLLANGAISLANNALVEGRILSREGAIALEMNVINVALPPVPANIMANGPTTFCQGGTVVLSGNIDGVWNNGEVGTSISVSTGGTFFVTNSSCAVNTTNANVELKGA
jgi:Ice-binding-like